MTLGELALLLGAELHGSPDVHANVNGVHRDSRRVAAGDVFVAIAGESSDGRRFAEAALAQGALAVVAEAPAAGPTLIVDDARRALGAAAHAVANRPTERLGVAAITGTNGKTTTAWLLRTILEVAAPKQVGLLGTVAASGKPSAFTTPEADDVARYAQQLCAEGHRYLVMEASSHGLALHRVEGVAFDVVAFTNLSQDHLDFHESMEDYAEAKARLFTELGTKHAVINIDDDFGATLPARCVAKDVLRVSPAGNRSAELWAEDVRFAAGGLRATLHWAGEAFSLSAPLVGAHNLENALVALGCAAALGVDKAEAVAALAQTSGAPGRLEKVADPAGRTVLVDYAHTPDALKNALAALRPLTAGKLIVVFGCGGDRDRGKRPLMGAAASAGADVLVVTSDNPRTEEPQGIIDEILPGIDQELAEGDVPESGYLVEADREQAIGLALRLAAPGDTVLIAGKGHEDYQIIGTEKRDFDDRLVAAAWLEKL